MKGVTQKKRSIAKCVEAARPARAPVCGPRDAGAPSWSFAPALGRFRSEWALVLVLLERHHQPRDDCRARDSGLDGCFPRRASHRVRADEGVDWPSLRPPPFVVWLARELRHLVWHPRPVRWPGPHAVRAAGVVGNRYQCTAVRGRDWGRHRVPDGRRRSAHLPSTARVVRATDLATPSPGWWWSPCYT